MKTTPWTLRPMAVIPVLALALALAVPGRAAAQVEIEADPMAYAMSGFSLHLAKVVGAMRVSVGTFGAEIPTFYHGNEGWSSTMRGSGLKVDYLGSDVDGFFAGVEGGYMRMRYTLDSDGGSTERDAFGVGVRGGYRWPIGSRGLYVVPWVGVGYNFDGDDVYIAGEHFRRGPVTVFPTVHVGWRF